MVKWMYRGIVREQGKLYFTIYLQATHIEVLNGHNTSGEILLKKINDRIAALQSVVSGDLRMTRYSITKPGHKETTQGQIRFECRSRNPDTDVITLVKLRQTVKAYVLEATGHHFCHLRVSGKKAEQPE